MQDHDWWRGAVIYQIYPRSFCDMNGDGIGDIPGIISKLNYIASLGVDAIWISPFFTSPMKDFGYDISDYRNVDPIFGCLDDFDELIEKAHELGIKVIIDQVLSHTSDQHAWFQQSRENQTNDKADWYVWADANPDGTPPNNWLSIFGGVAWQWEPRRKQYYLHNFLASQPDLNFHNPEVKKAMLDNVEFWLKKGVDGLRVDAVNFCFHDANLTDNPAKPEELRTGRGFSPDNPYAFQYHYYNNTQPENLRFMEELRALTDQYPGATMLGEISSENSLATMAEYTEGTKRLHMAYSFELLTDDFNAKYLRETIEQLESQMGDGWPCWAIGNHDVQRVVTRWGKKNSSRFTKMLFALLGSIRGTVCSYQGDELGLEEADIPFERLQDPYGITFWPKFKGRDGCRTPMPWQKNQVNSGFSNGVPWLPIPSSHTCKAIDVQDGDPSSALNCYRAFNQWRRSIPLLQHGDIQFLDTEEPVLAFVRASNETCVAHSKLLVCLNLSDSVQQISLKGFTIQDVVTGHGIQSGTVDNEQVYLPEYGVFYAYIKPN